MDAVKHVLKNSPEIYTEYYNREDGLYEDHGNLYLRPEGTWVNRSNCRTSGRGYPADLLDLILQDGLEDDLIRENDDAEGADHEYILVTRTE